MALLRRELDKRCSLSAMLSRDAVGIDRKLHEIQDGKSISPFKMQSVLSRNNQSFQETISPFDIHSLTHHIESRLENAQYSLHELRAQHQDAQDGVATVEHRLKMTHKEIKGLRSAMGTFQGQLDAERRKAKLFRDQMEKFKNEAQEHGFEAQLEQLVAEAQKSVAQSGDECRRYGYKCSGHRIRNDWKGCICGCGRTITGDLEERLSPWNLEGMPGGLMLDCRGAGGNGGTPVCSWLSEAGIDQVYENKENAIRKISGMIYDHQGRNCTI